MPQPSNPFAEACRHLKRRDPVLKRLIAAVGSCTLTPDPDGFAVLARSIISQLISVRAAATIASRLLSLLEPYGGLTAQAVMAVSEDSLRSVGLSGAKARSIRAMAERSVDGRLPFGQFDALDDDAVIAALTELSGIGIWTAHMFLIFSQGRPDILPTGDMGLRAGFKDRYGLTELPGPMLLREHAEVWRPYRSIATWYLWKSRSFVTRSKG